MPDFPRRGQIHWVDFSPALGSEQAGKRPAVVVSNDVANRNSTVVTVVPLTRTIPRKNYPQNVTLEANRPLPEPGTILCGQVRTVSKERFRGYRADLSAEQVEQVDRALATALGLPMPAKD